MTYFMVRIRNLGNQKTHYIFFINSSNCSSDRYAMLSALAAFNDFKTAVVLPLTMMLEKTLESAMGEAIPAHLSTASKIEAVWSIWSCSRGSGFGEIPVSKRGSPRKRRRLLVSA